MFLLVTYMTMNLLHHLFVLDLYPLLHVFCYRVSSAFITVISFLLGALCSGIAGYVGMWVSVRANVRVSSAARRSAREALQVGGVSSFLK